MKAFDAFKNKRVFITGHTGFKGSWMSLWLCQLGAEVCGYALKPNTTPSLFNILNLDKKIKNITADVRDLDRLSKEVKNFSPDVVIHMAAQPLVRTSYENPIETFQTNVLGTANILEACRKAGNVKAFVNVTTDKCYKNKEKNYAYKEDDELGGYDPYSNSKACSELITSSYRDSFFNPKDYNKTHKTGVATARAGNVIGGGDYSKDRLLPDFIKAIESGKDIVLRNPNAIRPWQFVLEPLSGYLLLAKKLLEGDISYASSFNFGPQETSIITVEDIVKNSIKIYGKGSYVIDKSKQPHEATLLQLDITKAQQELNWEPVYSVYEAIKQTINWYKNYQNGTDMVKFSINQINEFSDKVNF